MTSRTPSSSLTTRLSTHNTRPLANNAQIETYSPPSSFETFGMGISHPLETKDTFSLEDSSKSFVASHFNIDPNSIVYHSGFSGDITHHAFLKQVHDTIPFSNAVANVVFNKDNKVVSVGSSFITPKSIAPSQPTISLENAISTAEQATNGKYNGHPASLEYYVKPDHTIVLVHAVQIKNTSSGSWREAFVDAHTNQLVSVVDFGATG